MPKGNQNRETQQNTLPFSACEAGKGNEKQRNPRNPLPLKQVWLPKGNQNRETQQIRCLSRLVKREKATKIEGIPEICCPTHAFPLFYILSAITAEVIFIQEKEKKIKFVKNACEK